MGMQCRTFIVEPPLVKSYVTCAIQKAPPAITPNEATVRRDMIKMRQAPHVPAQTPGVQSIAFDSDGTGLGAGADFLDMPLRT